MRLAIVTAAALFFTGVIADDTPTCGNGKQCPESKPCCSQFGECGTGLYCLGACDPVNSFNASACAPMPVCKAQDSKFNNMDRVVDQTKYFGDADKYDWVVNGKAVNYQDNLLLTMAKNSYGTVLSSTRYMWYGKVAATIKTSHGAGVVSAFILMSGSKDEVDYEFVGNDVGHAQTNYYYEGVLDYENSVHASLSNTNESFHTYEFDWTEDQITWSIDGQEARTLKKSDTYNETTKQHMYPQSPSIIQLSLWPGGSDKNAEGTVEWAGGPIDWNMPEFSNPGYLYATIEEIKVDCYDAPSDAQKSGSKAYVWDGKGIQEGNIKITDDDYVLGSFDAVGYDMGKGNSSNIQSASQAAPTGNGSGNDHGKNSKSIADASEVSVTQTSSKKSSSSSSSRSLQDVSGSDDSSSSSTSLPNITGGSNGGSGSGSGSNEASNTGSGATSTSTAAGNTENGGFDLGTAVAASTSSASSGGTVTRPEFGLHYVLYTILASVAGGLLAAF